MPALSIVSDTIILLRRVDCLIDRIASSHAPRNAAEKNIAADRAHTPRSRTCPLSTAFPSDMTNCPLLFLLHSLVSRHMLSRVTTHFFESQSARERVGSMYSNSSIPAKTAQGRYMGSLGYEQGVTSGLPRYEWLMASKYCRQACSQCQSVCSRIVDELGGHAGFDHQCPSGHTWK